jgi:hypothetical protein
MDLTGLGPDSNTRARPSKGSIVNQTILINQLQLIFSTFILTEVTFAISCLFNFFQFCLFLMNIFLKEASYFLRKMV